MERKTETNLLAQIVIKGNLNINSILYVCPSVQLKKTRGKYIVCPRHVSYFEIMR
jgi:hypothetical protein